MNKSYFPQSPAINTWSSKLAYNYLLNYSREGAATVAMEIAIPHGVTQYI